MKRNRKELAICRKTPKCDAKSGRNLVGRIRNTKSQAIKKEDDGEPVNESTISTNTLSNNAFIKTEIAVTDRSSTFHDERGTISSGLKTSLTFPTLCPFVSSNTNYIIKTEPKSTKIQFGFNQTDPEVDVNKKSTSSQLSNNFTYHVKRRLSRSEPFAEDLSCISEFSRKRNKLSHQESSETSTGQTAALNNNYMRPNITDKMLGMNQMSSFSSRSTSQESSSECLDCSTVSFDSPSLATSIGVDRKPYKVVYPTNKNHCERIEMSMLDNHVQVEKDILERFMQIQKLISSYQGDYSDLQAKLQALKDVKIALLQREHKTIVEIEQFQKFLKACHVQVPGMDTFQELREQHMNDLKAAVEEMLTRFNFVDTSTLLDVLSRTHSTNAGK